MKNYIITQQQGVVTLTEKATMEEPTVANTKHLADFEEKWQQYKAHVNFRKSYSCSPELQEILKAKLAQGITEVQENEFELSTTRIKGSAVTSIIAIPKEAEELIFKGVNNTPQFTFATKARMKKWSDKHKLEAIEYLKSLTKAEELHGFEEVNKGTPEMDAKVEDELDKLDALTPEQDDVEKLAVEILKSHKDYKAEGYSEYQNGRHNGIIEGLNYKANQPAQEVDWDEVLRFYYDVKEKETSQIEDIEKVFEADSSMQHTHTFHAWLKKNYTLQPK